MSTKTKLHHRAGPQPPNTLDVHVNNLIPEAQNYITRLSKTDEWYDFSLNEMSRHINIPWTSLRVIMSNNELGRDKVIEMIRQANFQYFERVQSEFNEAYDRCEITHPSDRYVGRTFRNFAYMPYTSYQLGVRYNNAIVRNQKMLAEQLISFHERHGFNGTWKEFYTAFNSSLYDTDVRLTPSQLLTVLQHIPESLVRELYPKPHKRLTESIQILKDNPRVTNAYELGQELGLSRQATHSIMYREREVMRLLEANEKSVRQHAQEVYVEEALTLIDSGIESVELIAEKAFHASKDLAASTDGLALYELLKITKMPHIETNLDHLKAKQLRDSGMTFLDVALELGSGAMAARAAYYYQDYREEVKEMWKHDFVKAFNMFKLK